MKNYLIKLRKGFSLDPYNQIVAKGHETRLIDFEDKENHFIVANEERINQLRVIAKIMCLADIMNEEFNWLPEYGEMAFYLDAKLDVNCGNSVNRVNFVPFKRIKDAEKAAEILLSDQDFKQARTISPRDNFGIKSNC
jgi:hypothetical protein